MALVHPLPDDLTDGVIRLRPWRADEAAVLVGLIHASQDTVGHWIPWCSLDYTVTKAEAWLRQVHRGWQRGHGECALAIVDAATDIPVGNLVLNQFREPAVADLGYWMSSAAQGKGWMTRAVALGVPVAMAALGVRRLEVVIAVENLASRRVTEKAGGRYDHHAADRLKLIPGWAAVYVFEAPAS
jgi:ribosomal-protein-serine acetyltransferase